MWDAVAAVRADNAWEVPVAEVTAMVTGQSSKGKSELCHVDAWQSAASRKGPLSSCRFNTRIDYIFLASKVAETWTVTECEHVVAIPAVSDHNLVVATLVMGSDDGSRRRRLDRASRRSPSLRVLRSNTSSRVVNAKSFPDAPITTPPESCLAALSSACMEPGESAVDKVVELSAVAEASSNSHQVMLTEIGLGQPGVVQHDSLRELGNAAVEAAKACDWPLAVSLFERCVEAKPDWAKARACLNRARKWRKASAIHSGLVDDAG